MRLFRLAPLALLLLACGGTAQGTKPAPASGGAAGEPSRAAGTGPTSNEGGVSAGGVSAGGVSAGGVSAGGVSAGGVSAGGGDSAAGDSGVAAAGRSSVGAGGEPSASGCQGLGCLAGAELLYRPDRAWQPTSDAPSRELDEADYEPLLGPKWLVQLSSDAQTLDLTPMAGGDTVHGTRDPQRQDEAFFELMLFAGGRFRVQAVEGELRAEYTVYGSGSPIISSTRGLLVGP